MYMILTENTSCLGNREPQPSYFSVFTEDKHTVAVALEMGKAVYSLEGGLKRVVRMTESFDEVLEGEV